MADPIFHTNADVGLTLGTVELKCHANAIAAEVDQDQNDYETFCGGFSAYGAEKWTINVTAYQSFGTDGLWTKVRPLVGTLQTFTLRPDDDGAAGVGNPHMTGTARVKAFPFLAGAVGEAAEVELVLAVQGTPTFDVAP